MIYLFVFLLVTSLMIMIPSRRSSLIAAGAVIFTFAMLSSWMALQVLISGNQSQATFLSFLQENISPLIVCDKLSAFFILVINFTVLTGFIYSWGYLKPYLQLKSEPWIKLHYLALAWLQASMVMVPLFRNGFYFLMVWEIMTLSSFILVIFEYDTKGTLRAGLNYLIQMHVGMLFILAGFLISSKGLKTISFDNLTVWFLNNPNWPVFLLFFIGFGLKAGFFFLHTWLPDAHPAAPSHVSGIMSGVMIKLGIYGILRVSTFLVRDLAQIGAAMIVISAITGVFGVMMAILQHDVKRLLAYHSIENIGIIGLGIGLGIFGSATGNPVVSTAGYAGALLHTLNHSLFKSLLFYGAGSVTSAIHTRNIEKMGGIMRFMPLTSWAFLIGAVAISGIPPFNGFISEFLVYFSMFSGIGQAGFYSLILLFIAIISLVMIGGLALLCFTKVFSVIFLGQPRQDYQEKPKDPKGSMISAKLLAVVPIFLIGFLPFIIVKPVLELAGTIFRVDSSSAALSLSDPMKYISIGALVLLFIIALIFLVRKLFLSGKPVISGPTWGCGYEAVNSRQQYTATSFIQEYSGLTNPIIKTGHTNIDYGETEVFPDKREFHTHSDDFIKSKLIIKPADFMVNLLRKAAVFQTGKLQHYVLYVLFFLVLILFLTIFKVI
jgi:hydrogenase-4 component B